MSRPAAAALLAGILLAGSCGTPVEDSPAGDAAADAAVQEDGSAAPTPSAIPRADASTGPDASASAASPLIRAEARELTGELLDSATVDLEGDGTPERVELRAEVARDARGRLMWDDGQPWTLVVRTAEGVYTLFDDYVQLGTLGFWLLQPGTDAPVTIMSLEDVGSGVRMRRYDWVPGERAFRQVDAIEAHGNVLHSPQEPT